MGTGMAVGAGGAFWAKHKVEATVERYMPDHVANRAASQARDLGRTVRAAASEGREAMRQREQELRSLVEARTFVGVRDMSALNVVPDEPAAARGARRVSRPASSSPATSVTRRRSRR